MEQEVTLQEVFSDLAIIRRAVERVGRDTLTEPPQVLGTNLVLQVIGLTAALTLTVNELLSNHISSQMLAWSATSSPMAVWVLTQIGFALLLGLATVYIILRGSAKQADRPYATFVARHFSHLQHFGLATDLLVKYLIVTFVILGRQPALLAPLCSLFVADWLFQGRFFTLPTRVSLFFGGAAVIASAVQFQLLSDRLIYPAAIFSLVAAYSVSRLVVLKKRLRAPEQLPGEAR